jgi:hypothetical protein
MEVLLWKVGGRELPRGRKETEQQILRRRGTLISLGIVELDHRDDPQVICVMPYMADC